MLLYGIALPSYGVINVAICYSVTLLMCVILMLLYGRALPCYLLPVLLYAMSLSCYCVISVTVCYSVA